MVVTPSAEPQEPSNAAGTWESTHRGPRHQAVCEKGLKIQTCVCHISVSMHVISLLSTSAQKVPEEKHFSPSSAHLMWHQAYKRYNEYGRKLQAIFIRNSNVTIQLNFQDTTGFD